MTEETLLGGDTGGEPPAPGAEDLYEKPEEGAPKDEPKPEEKLEAEAESKKEEPVELKAEDITLPEGVELDEEMMKGFLPLAKELGLTKEQAQKLVDLQSTSVQKAAEEQQKAWESQVGEWQTAAKSDKEFGGDKFSENIGKATAFLKEFGTPELSKALDATGFGNHPEMIRLAVKMGMLMSEGRIHNGKSSPNGPTDPAKTLFPSMN